jgi:hypothetical protein
MFSTPPMPPSLTAGVCALRLVWVLGLARLLSACPRVAGVRYKMKWESVW